MSPLIQPRLGGHIQCPDDGCTDGQYIWMFVVFILLMIAIVLIITSGVLSCVFACKARRRGIGPEVLSQKKINHRAAFIVLTFGLILLSKRFRERQHEMFGAFKGEFEPLEHEETHDLEDVNIGYGESNGENKSRNKLRSLFVKSGRVTEVTA